MNDATQKNLDRLAAECAQKVINCRPEGSEIKDMENTVTKALGVLQENGVYACFLYLLAKEDEKGKVVVDKMLDLLNQLNFGWGKPSGISAEKVLDYINNKVVVNLECLLLAKETLEQMLIYARYGAKACK